MGLLSTFSNIPGELLHVCPIGALNDTNQYKDQTRLRDTNFADVYVRLRQNIELGYLMNYIRVAPKQASYRNLSHALVCLLFDRIFQQPLQSETRVISHDVTPSSRRNAGKLIRILSGSRRRLPRDSEVVPSMVIPLVRAPRCDENNRTYLVIIERDE